MIKDHTSLAKRAEKLTRIENKQEFTKMFPVNAGFRATKDKGQFTKIDPDRLTYPLIIGLIYNGPDAASVGLGHEWKIIPRKDVEDLYRETRRSLRDLHMLLAPEKEETRPHEKPSGFLPRCFKPDEFGRVDRVDDSDYER